jgi:flagellin-specific chaperone FliS
LDFYSASSLKQQGADIHVASLGQIILMLSQPALLFLFNAASLVEKQQIPIFLTLV